MKDLLIVGRSALQKRKAASPVPRGWSAVEYIDEGISGAKERRPALDRLMTDAKRRRLVS
jgi:hypothetical protein